MIVAGLCKVTQPDPCKMNDHLSYKEKTTFSLLLSLFLFLLIPQTSSAQDDQFPKIDFWGAFQPRISYGAMEDTSATLNRFGYGIRRARIRAEVMLVEKLGVRYDADFASGTFQSVDLFAFYRFSDNVTMRFGIMPSAQPRAHIFTPIPQIDSFDRAAIAEQWAGSTLGGGGRDFGIDLQYQTPEWTAVAFLHNGDGSFSRVRGNFSQTISSESATRGIERSVMATSFYVAHRFASLKGVEIGGYVSQNTSKNPNTVGPMGVGRDYVSYAAHAYYGANPGSQPFRLKLDVIGISFQGDDEQERFGVSILGAARLNAYTELFARYENAQQDTQIDDTGTDFFTAGLSFSLSKFNGGNFSDQRATLGYSMLESPSGNQQHLIVLQWQFMF